jgi:hypothetical protein
MTSSSRLSRYAVGLVVAGGAIWVVAAALYNAQIASCFSWGRCRGCSWGRNHRLSASSAGQPMEPLTSASGAT